MLRHAAKEAARLAAVRAAQQYSASTSGLSVIERLAPAASAHQQTWSSRGAASSDFGGTLLPSALAHQQSWLSTAAASSDVRAKLFNSQPRSLEADVSIDEPAPGMEENFFTRGLLRMAGFYSRESRLIRGARNLYADVVQQATNKELFEALGLEFRFANVYSMLCLHIWLLLVRLRAEGKDGKELAQMLYENFTDDVEMRVRAEGVKVRVSKWLAELERMFYGSSVAYDKALKGEGDFKDALLRNVYGDDPSREREAAILAKYVTRELACLTKTESEALMSGKIKFSTDFL